MPEHLVRLRRRQDGGRDAARRRAQQSSADRERDVDTLLVRDCRERLLDAEELDGCLIAVRLVVQPCDVAAIVFSAEPPAQWLELPLTAEHGHANAVTMDRHRAPLCVVVVRLESVLDANPSGEGCPLVLIDRQRHFATSCTQFRAVFAEQCDDHFGVRL